MSYDPTWDSLEEHSIPEWFRDAGFGVYFHWGPYSVPAYGSEWYPRQMYLEGSDAYEHHRETYGPQEEFGYHEFVPEFTGSDFDADRWARRCAEAGAEFVGLAAIHHDGFALWDSELTEWNAAEMGPERDVVGELAAAAREHGLKFVTAFHHAYTWWYYPRREGLHAMDPEYAGLYGPPHEEGEDPPESYFADWRDKVLEVVESYRPDLMWFDFGWGRYGAFLDHDEYRRETLAEYYNRAAEWGKEVDVTHKQDLPAGVGVVDHERSRREDRALVRWLTDTSVDRSSWGYVEEPAPDYKDPGTLVTGLVDRVSKNGATMLNLGPRPDGTVPEAQWERLAAVGDWMDTNGEAVSGVRPCWTAGEGPTEVTSTEFEEASSVEFTDADVRFARTPDGDAAYAVVMDWPADGEVTIETRVHDRLAALDDDDTAQGVESVELLGHGPLDWSEDEAGLHVTFPDAEPDACAHAYALRLTPAGPRGE